MILLFHRLENTKYLKFSKLQFNSVNSSGIYFLFLLNTQSCCKLILLVLFRKLMIEQQNRAQSIVKPAIPPNVSILPMTLSAFSIFSTILGLASDVKSIIFIPYLPNHNLSRNIIQNFLFHFTKQFITLQDFYRFLIFILSKTKEKLL